MSKHEQFDQFQAQPLSLVMSPVDIIAFLRKSWKPVVLFGALGLICATIFLWITPSQYEAFALIKVAKISTPQNTLGLNVEEPPALIARMASGSSFDNAVIVACGSEQSTDGADRLIKSVKMGVPKGVGSVVEIRVTRSSKEVAKACTQSIFDQIYESQQLVNKPLKKSAEARLQIINERLDQDKVLLSKFGADKNLAFPAYLSLLSEKRALEDEQFTLIETISGENLIPANLQYPIEVGTKPIYPKKNLSLMLGLLGGVFLGLLVALVRMILEKLNAESSRN